MAMGDGKQHDVYTVIHTDQQYGTKRDNRQTLQSLAIRKPLHAVKERGVHIRTIGREKWIELITQRCTRHSPNDNEIF